MSDPLTQAFPTAHPALTVTSAVAMARARALLPDALLEGIHARAARYDAENAWCGDDVAELREAGYLGILAPSELGGQDEGIEVAVACQRRLAAAAPATALTVNMHVIWMCVARQLWLSGDRSLEQILSDGARGELYAFGISEPGNENTLGDSVTVVEEVPGGITLTGVKTTTTAAPGWTRLGTFGRLAREDAPDELVHAIVTRGEGVSDRGNWSTLGMRATQSHTTDLTGAFVPKARIIRRIPLVEGPPDELVRAIFTSFSLCIAAVYAGAADAALALGREAARARRSSRLDAPFAEDPDVRRRLASAAIDLEGLDAQLTLFARDLEARTARGSAWFTGASGLKVRAVAVAKRVAEAALSVAGAQAYGIASELGRVARDIAAGPYHPTSLDAATRSFADALFG